MLRRKAKTWPLITNCLMCPNSFVVPLGKADKVLFCESCRRFAKPLSAVRSIHA